MAEYELSTIQQATKWKVDMDALCFCPNCWKNRIIKNPYNGKGYRDNAVNLSNVLFVPARMEPFSEGLYYDICEVCRKTITVKDPNWKKKQNE